MRKILTTLFAFFLLMTPCFAKDSVQFPGKTYSGKITSYSDGLIHIRQKGVEYSIKRQMNKDYYGDYVTYVEHPFERMPVEVRCRMSFIDTHVIIIETPTVRMKIPRYRVRTIVLYAS